jgi:glycosyltransferase involved in cell wall biosynthesis
MMLSIIIPVYNEKNTILKVIKEVEKVKLPNKLKKEIIIVDDCSIDGTREILRKIKNFKILYHNKNKGKGSAIRTGLGYAVGDIILIQDADLEYDPKEYPKLLKPILLNKAYVVYGSRLMNGKLSLLGKNKTFLPTHFIGNKFLSFVTSILYFHNVSDMETCYKVFKKNIVKDMQLKATRFDFEPEITAKILKKGYRILEVPIKFKPRSFMEGKKINFIDGIKAVYYLIKYRFVD